MKVAETLEVTNSFLKEVIIENFMSYEYARIPLRKGVNIICGPNGSGKSSILLALAVALGQTYTERGRKLSDLIRRGKDLARVTVVFDNSPRNGKRPIPTWRNDDFLLTRYIRKDGTYWQEINYKSVTKNEVRKFLEKVGINPENLLIIMHQNMIEEFSFLSPQEKLLMFEEAVGIKDYREKIIEGRNKLSAVLSEEEAVKTMLKKAHETLSYWEKEYGKFLEKKELLKRKKELERELAWAKVKNHERTLSKLQQATKKLEKEIRELKELLKKEKLEINGCNSQINKLRKQVANNYGEVIQLEKEITQLETKRKIYLEIKNLLGEEERVTRKKPLVKFLEEITFSQKEIDELKKKVREGKRRISSVEEERDVFTEKLIGLKISEALHMFKVELKTEELVDVNKEIRKVSNELKELKLNAELKGERVESFRKINEITDEIKLVNSRLMTLRNVSQDTETFYLNYKGIVKDLEEKARIAAENRKRAIEELELRIRKWREVVRSILRNVNKTYDEILKKLNAVGNVKFVNSHDVEEAGLELQVGFQGAEPQILDSYTQSGGERTVAVMSFLLALQQHIKSPIRAVDEFDVHMDPKNREALLNQLFSAVEKQNIQYIIITPGILPNLNEDVNVIVVQNVEGVSKTSSVE